MVLSPLPANAAPDTARFEELLQKGNDTYSQKQGYSSFRQSLTYFDSAQAIADKSRNISMLAAAAFARGRIYDAWNKEPEETITLFKKASALFRQVGDEDQYLYTKHLVAHAYDKKGDRAGAVAILEELMTEIRYKEPHRRQALNFIPEMALVATQVGSYELADSILRILTRREWITNDPQTYNYLDHYYLTKAQIELYGQKAKKTPYIDSLAVAYNGLSNLSDKLYYAEQLGNLYEAQGSYAEAFRFVRKQQVLEGDLFSGHNYEQMSIALAHSEVAAQNRKAEYEADISQSKTHAVWGLSILLTVITVLSIYLYRRNQRYRMQSRHLHDVNSELDKQVSKIELLNKEMQHRVKNNLYTIYSLLHMQQDSTDNEEVVAHLRTARLRVESIAALHDHLQAETDVVDFGSYIKVLISKVVASLVGRRKVITHISTQTVSLPLNTCFALSLILNEWITNSIKYAATSTEILTLNIAIINKEKEVCISYSDDGIIAKNTPSQIGLGTEIVRLLTAQIEGELTLIADHFYHYNLSIPHE